MQVFMVWPYFTFFPYDYIRGISEPLGLGYLGIADVFCRPSIDEGFGISFIESMACQIPTIGTEVGGIIDIIKDGENGLLVPPENVGALTGAIKRLIEDENLANKIAEEGLNTVRERFTWEAVLKEMDRVYETLMR